MRDKLDACKKRSLVLLVADLLELQLLDACDSFDLLLIRPFKVNLVQFIVEILKHRQFANTLLDKIDASLWSGWLDHRVDWFLKLEFEGVVSLFIDYIAFADCMVNQLGIKRSCRLNSIQIIDLML